MPDADLGATVPKGIILPWYNKDGAATPSGWALCDGSLGTPDLRGQFLRGAASIGGSGGKETHTHSISKGNNDGSGFQSEGPQCQLVVPNNVNHLPPYIDVQFIIKL